MIYSIRLPLQKDELGYYFDTNNSLEEHVAHLLKNVIFTRRGEYLMNYNYGIGLQDSLFDNINESTKNGLRVEIMKQIRTYVTQINVTDVMVYDSIDYQKGLMFGVVSDYYAKFFGTEPLGENELLISILYSIKGQDENKPKLMSLIINM
jgi:phage baseplate assembly protein W